MTREELKQSLWQLRCALDQLEDDAGNVSSKLGLQGKGLVVYDYLQGMEFEDAVKYYERLNDDNKAKFMQEVTGEKK